MGVAKSLNRLAILGLLACGGAWAQDTISVRVGLSTPGPFFLIDGQAYSTPQVMNWVVGSSHQVYFVQSQESDGTLGNHQYPTNIPGTRYTFGGWTLSGQAPVGNQGALLMINVESTLTQILGQVNTEVALYVYFNGYTDPNLPCSATAVSNDPREGVMLVGATCFSAPSTFWVVPGPFTFTAGPFPGFIFTNWVINGNIVPGQTLSEYPIVGPTNVAPMFVKAKRARFRSNPLGLSLTIDHQLVKPGPVLNGPYSGDPYCPIDYALLPVGFPVGYKPLCVGDFDFLPGSQHLIGAPPVQTDAQGKTWVFTGFSNGMGQNAIYTADSDINATDTVNGNFVAGLPARVVTSPAGLTVNIDGQDDSKGSLLLWAEGQTHHLVAPATQTDASGHPWKFVSWSNGGSADQSYTVPTGLPGLTLTATYEPLGKLQVDSVPSGLPFNVDGAACTTPCILVNKATGAQVQVVAPASVSADAYRRYDFRTWNGGSTSNTFQVTIGDHAQVFVATYQAFYKLTASSQPINHVTFAFNPPSADGFFADGTQVAVTATPTNGFQFKRWSGDLSGNNVTASVVMNAPRFAVAVLDGFPFISENGVKNAAGDTPSGTVGPGSDISIFGDNLASSLQVAPAGELAQALDDVWVTVNDRLLPLLFISPQQINAQLFSDLPDGDYTLTVHHTAQQDASRNFKVRRNSPGLFQWYPAQGSPTVAAFRENGTMLTADNPATLNETISIYGTGFGLYDRPLVDGFPTPDTGNWNLVDPVKVTVDGQTYTPVTSRAANGLAGMVVLRVKLTGTLPSGLVNVKVTVNNVDSNTSKLPVK
ncbi:MAG: hypothetical protein JWO19_5261 [Bryobacterales bacterium]|nr:hypothetical protein [Bryobacterales bacterium]